MVSFLTADKEEFMPVILESFLYAAHLMMSKTSAKTKKHCEMLNNLWFSTYQAPRTAGPVEPAIGARYDRTGCEAG